MRKFSKIIFCLYRYIDWKLFFKICRNMEIAVKDLFRKRSIPHYNKSQQENIITKLIKKLHHNICNVVIENNTIVWLLTFTMYFILWNSFPRRKVHFATAKTFFRRSPESYCYEIITIGNNPPHFVLNEHLF